jgi:hypothetical protein
VISAFCFPDFSFSPFLPTDFSFSFGYFPWPVKWAGYFTGQLSSLAREVLGP